jgi:hypothetical protein
VSRKITWKAFRKGKEKELLRLTDVGLKEEIAEGRRRSESKDTRLDRLEATEDYAAKRAGSLTSVPVSRKTHRAEKYKGTLASGNLNSAYTSISAVVSC